MNPGRFGAGSSSQSHGSACVEQRGGVLAFVPASGRFQRRCRSSSKPAGSGVPAGGAVLAALGSAAVVMVAASFCFLRPVRSTGDALMVPVWDGGRRRTLFRARNAP